MKELYGIGMLFVTKMRQLGTCFSNAVLPMQYGLSFMWLQVYHNRVVWLVCLDLGSRVLVIT